MNPGQELLEKTLNLSIYRVVSESFLFSSPQMNVRAKVKIKLVWDDVLFQSRSFYMCPSHDPQICSFSFMAQNFSGGSGSWSIDWIGEKAFVKVHVEKNYWVLWVIY